MCVCAAHRHFSPLLFSQYAIINRALTHTQKAARYRATGGTEAGQEE